MIKCNICNKEVLHVYEELSRPQDRIHVECLIEVLNMHKRLILASIRRELILTINKRMGNAYVLDQLAFLRAARDVVNAKFEEMVQRGTLKSTPENFDMHYINDEVLIDILDEEILKVIK